MATKAKASTIKQKIATTDDVAKKVYLGMKEGKVIFGEMEESTTDHSITRKWKAEPLDNKAEVSFMFDHKKGKNKDGKDYNPRYKVYVTFKDTTEEFSGTFARKIYLRLMNPPKKRTSKLSADTASVMEDALSGL